MNRKSYSRSTLSAAVISALAMSGAVVPSKEAFGSTASVSSLRTGADAIIGTGADAIIGTGKQKTASADAIIGTGRNRGGKSDAIIGTGADAIIGTGADAIIGTGKQKTASADAIIGTGRNLVLKGPVEKFNAESGIATIAGRDFRISPASGLYAQVSGLFSIGAIAEVAVYARLGAKGEFFSATAKLVPGQYVAGVSEIVLSGAIKTIKHELALAVIGNSVVDYSSLLLASSNLNFGVGDVVSVSGTQPLPGDRVLAIKIEAR